MTPSFTDDVPDDALVPAFTGGNPFSFSSEEGKRKIKKTDNPREGWEDGTPPPHRDFRGEVWC